MSYRKSAVKVYHDKRQKIILVLHENSQKIMFKQWWSTISAERTIMSRLRLLNK